MKYSNAWLLFILSCAISSCAILGGQSPENIKKNNTFEVFCNVEGAKIEVLDKPHKEYFESTNNKSTDGLYYSTNTYNKLRIGRTKLLVSKEGYVSDTIRIHRVPRAEVVVCDLLIFNILTL